MIEQWDNCTIFDLREEGTHRIFKPNQEAFNPCFKNIYYSDNKWLVAGLNSDSLENHLSWGWVLQKLRNSNENIDSEKVTDFDGLEYTFEKAHSLEVKDKGGTTLGFVLAIGYDYVCIERTNKGYVLLDFDCDTDIEAVMALIHRSKQ